MAATARDIYVYSGQGKQLASIDAAKITFAGGAMMVENLNGQTQSVPLSNFDYFLLHGQQMTGVHSVATATTAITCRGNMVTATSQADIAMVRIYSTLGTVVKSVKPNGPVASISLDDLNTGIYIVQVKTGATVVTKKIIKR